MPLGKIDMSDKPYEKECIFCKARITMSKELGKWGPYNKDGSAHVCREKNGNGNGKEKYTLDDVQKKLESIGIIVNVERLMKQ
jgi:hypothetical protein